MPTLKTEGIILRAENYREYDKFFTLYTRDYGKLRCIATGVRKIVSKQAGHLEPFMRSYLMLAWGRSGMLKLATGSTVDAFLGLRHDLHKMALASYCVELLDKAIGEEQADEEAFEMLLDILSLIQDSAFDALPRADWLLLARCFAIRLLAHLGYQPEFFSCLGCQKLLKENTAGLWFSPLLGGLIEDQCRLSMAYDFTWRLDPPVHNALRQMLSSIPLNILFLPNEPRLRLHLSNVIQSFITHHLEIHIESERWLEMLFPLTL